MIQSGRQGSGHPVSRIMPRSLLCSASLFAVLATGVPLSVHAEERHWDANATGVGSGGSGTWDLASLNWSPNGDGVSGPYVDPWDNSALDDAIFGGVAGTVTLGAPITVHDITFNTNGYVLDGGTLTLGGSTPTISVTTGTTRINSVVAGASGLAKAGGGALQLYGANSFSGDIALLAGSLYAATDGALGAASNPISTAAGADVTLRIDGAGTARSITIGDGGTLRVSGAGIGSALISGNGRVYVGASNNNVSIVRLTNDANSYTGATIFNGCNGVCSAYFSSIADLGVASSLGAPTTVSDGTIIFNQSSQYSDSLIYIGDGDSSNRNWDLNSSGAVIRNQGTGTLILTGDIDISSAGSFNAESADYELLGVLSGGSYSFNAYAGRTITLGAANTFTGTAGVSGLVQASVLADIGTASSLGTGTNINVNAGTLSYTGSGASSDRTWTINAASSILNNGSGALDLSGDLSFSTSSPNPDNLTLGGSFSGVNSVSGVISGNGNLVSDGAGTWVLSGANTYTGTVTVDNGILRAGNASAFGNTTGFTVNGGTLDLNGHDLTTPSLGGTGGEIALGSGTLTVLAKTAQNYAGGITGSGGLTKSGAGTLTLTGASTYSGATTINGGTLKLDFSGAGGSADNIISASSPLVLSGGTIEVQGADGETNGQSFNGLTVSAGSNTVRAVSGTGGGVDVSLGAISRTGGLVNFVLPDTGAITTSNADGALGGWATINGSDYAKVLSGGIVAFDATDYTNKDDAGTWLSGEIISDSDGLPDTAFFGTVGSHTFLGGLRYTAAADSTVTIAGSSVLGVDGTIIVAPSVGDADQTITGGFLSSGLGGGTLGVQQNGAGLFTIASQIADNAGVTSFAKGGTGTVALAGSNSYTGSTTLTEGILRANTISNGGVTSSIGASTADASNLVIEGGTFQYTGGTATTDRGFTLVNGSASRTIEVTNTAANLTFAGQVTSPDDAGFTKTGAGTLTLANAGNDYVGVTTVSGGTLAAATLADGGLASSIGAASGDSANIVLAGGALAYTGTTTSTDRGMTLGTGGGTIGVTDAGTVLTVSGILTGTSLSKTGDGTLILSGANTYTGNTIVNGGTLQAGSTTAFGSTSSFITVNSGGTLDLGGFDIVAAGLTGGGTVVLGDRTLTTNGGSAIFTGTITGTGGYTRTGSYTQTFSGCGNSYTGVTTLAGRLSVDCLADGGVNSGIGASGSDAANLALQGGALAYTGGTVAIDRGFTLVSGTSSIDVVNAATTLTITGAILGTGALQKDGAGTLVLAGTNGNANVTRVAEGTLRAGADNVLGRGALSIFNSATALLELDGHDNIVSYITGGGTTGGRIDLGGATLTVSTGYNSSADFAGIIEGSGSLIKNGSSYQALSGCDNSYDGATIINGGTFAVTCLGDGGADSSIGSSSAAAGNLVLNGGTLRYVGAGDSTDRRFTLGATSSRIEGSGTGAIVFTDDSALTFLTPNSAQTLTLGGTNTDDNILAAQITNNGTGITRLTKTDAGTWILTNPNSSYTGITTISGGVLGVDKLADGGLASSIGASSAAASNLVIGNGSTLRYTGTGDTTNRLFTLSSGVTYIESSGTGAIMFTDTGTVTLANNNQARTIALGGTNTDNNTLAASIGNAGTGVTTLAKNDSGTWVLTGNHSYTGSTNVNGGILFIGDGGTTGSIVSATVNDFGTLGFDRSDTLTYAGNIVGTGSVLQQGTGTTILTGTSSYSGGTTISAGTLQLGNGGTTGSIVGDVANDGTFTFDRSNGYTFGGVISGSGIVSQIGTGTTVLTGINSYSGGTLIDAGTLQISADANLGAASGDVTFDGGTLRTTASLTSGRDMTLTGAGAILTDTGTTFDLGGTISGAGAFTKAGAGTLVLTADSDYTGGTTIGAGTLQLGDGGTGGWIEGDVANNGTLTFDRSDNKTFAGLVSGTGGLIQNGSGIVTLTADNSYAGATVLNAGTLRINGDQSAATGLTTVNNGATLGGSGLIGGSVVVNNGGVLAPGNSPGTLTIAGNLSLSSGSVLDFEFGEANVVGGALNDLVEVGGDLVLDGTINVTVPTGGSFDGGIYRVFNYDGTLTDNGLDLGTMPTGSSVTVQTSVAGQVNLVNATGLELSFWDGDAGPKVNSVVDGGAGTWHLGGTDNNWTDASGGINAAYADGTFAIFAGTGDVVTVDNGDGAVTASGMQFASDGYTITGDALTLTDPQSVIRVGDGTAAGAGFTTVISAELTGTAGVAKTDLGTLILTGANSYTGGTTIDAGTLQVSANANLGAAAGGLTFSGGALHVTDDVSTARDFVFSDLGIVTIDAGKTLDHTGNMTGTGGLTKDGAGTLTFSGSGDYSGSTRISAGLFSVENGGSINFTPLLTVGGTDARFTVDGSGSSVSTDMVWIGSGATSGALAVSNGGVFNGNAMVIGTDPAGASAVDVDGAGSVVTLGTSLHIGGTGQGAMTISDGARVDTDGTAIIGYNGTTGTLTINDSEWQAGITSVGNGAGANGTLVATGASTLVQSAGALTAGVNGGSGDVTLSNGALATALSSFVGRANSTGTMLIDNAGLDVDNNITVGYGAGSDGTLTVTNGSSVSAGRFVIAGVDASALGAATIEGAGTTFSIDNLLAVGDAGTGTLTIDDLAAVSAGNVVIGEGAGSSGDLLLSNGTLTTGQVEAGAGVATFTFDAGTLVLSAAQTDLFAGFAPNAVTLGAGGGTIDTQAFDAAIAATIGGVGALDKVGSGMLTLFGANSYAGATDVNAGTLLVNGDQSLATGLTSVASGATLGGAGTIGGDVTVAGGGSVNPGLADATPAVLTVNGDLSLAGGATLNFDFGQANVVGGALNDLIEVGGDLVLAGTLNVDTSSGGSFDPGIYRVINYNGTLTDNGLTIGSIPSGTDFYVQTSVANQVNLINTDGLALRFWDGAAGVRNDGVITGGDGIWQNVSGNDNWTLDDGSVNAPFLDSAFAVFQGVGGTVTVDDGLGAVNAAGMQFASDDYVVEGDGIALVAAQSVIRVGDGTAAGAGYTATIASALTAAGDLVKSDLGTLVLTGANSVTDDVYARAGEFRLAAGGMLSSANGLIGVGAGEQAVVTVTGSNGIGTPSTWAVGAELVVGYGGTGTLTIADGGSVTSDTGTIGYDSGGIGQVLVTGPGSSWENDGRISVGLYGTGSLRIEDAARVSSYDGVVGGAGPGEVVVSGSGSIWTNAQQLTIGSFGTGAMRIEDGASVTSNQGYIGANADGSVVVTGVGSNWTVTTSSMTVGNVGTGVLTIEDGGLVHADGGLLLGMETASGGTLALQGVAGSEGVLETSFVRGGLGTVSFSMDGGLLRATQDGNDFFVDFDAHDLVLGANGGIIDTNGHNIGISPRFTGSGGLTKSGAGVLTLTGDNGYTGGTTIAAGTLQLGDGGTIGNIAGDVVNGGTLAFNRSDDVTFAGLISGTGGVAQNGVGVVTLTGANSYAGATDVNAGTLLVNGDQSAATGLTSVASGASLGGTGIIGGDVVIADGATLTPGAGGAGALGINGDLTLAAGAILDYQFGRASAPGDALNDVVNIGGDLVLDGTINVDVTPGGSFEVGLYRVANYSGTLTDNGLGIGTLPTGANVQVQTSVANQVNLVNRGSATLNFWDGAAGPKFDGAVNGGDGVWQNGTGNDNWTETTGAVNAAYEDGAFAIFSATSGTVGIDNSLGIVSASGMQFASDGYVITGDALTLAGPQSIVRVGDGTSAGADFTATIEAALVGDSQLVKTDAGTLVLSGTNSYSGGTLLNAGTLQISGDANLGDASTDLGIAGGTLHTTANIASGRAVDLAGAGTLLTDDGTVLTLNGLVSGTGSLIKSGAGTLMLTADNSYVGTTAIEAGTLFIMGDQSLASGITSVASGATLGGTGTIGGDVTLADGATLAPGAGAVGTLIINGNLALASGTRLAFEFGEANAAGGALNDLVTVGGDLTLDGTIDVTVPAGGAFDAGVYRVFDYGGTLTDNGLALGTMPAGSNTIVQTSVAGQVNLVNSAGLTLNFWDGTDGIRNNGAIEGGNGLWQNSAGDDSWTEATGAVNAAYADGAFAIFSGTGGTVTVDNSLGAVTASGMQFTADGYAIGGDELTLVGAQSVIRVGDGSTAGADMTATIGAVLTGDAQLVKTDPGTLVLAGANSYTGGAAVQGGTLVVSADANLGDAAGNVTLDGGTLRTTADFTSDRSVALAGDSTILTDADTRFTLNGGLSGTGVLTKAGAGTLVLTGDNAGYTAGGLVTGGTLAVDGIFGGNVDVASGGRLEGNGSVANIVNAGVVAPGRGIGTLTVAGDYVGAGGALEIEAVLGGDGSATDRLVVGGGTFGTTRVTVINRDGLGAPTVEGIRIIDVAGASDGSFVLNGDYMFQGEQAVIAGAYGYRLYKNGVADPQDGDWYLRSSLLNPPVDPVDPEEPGEPGGPDEPEQPQPLYQPGVPVYEGYAQTLQALNGLPTLQQRVGNRAWANVATPDGIGIWGRMDASRQRPEALVSTSGADQNIDSWQMQMGLDAVLGQRSDGATLIGGITAHYGEADNSIASIFGNGKIDTQGYGLGATLTWYGPEGFYTDAQAKFSWFDSDLKSDTLGTLVKGNDGRGQAFSLEVGKRSPVGNKLTLTPQIQMIYAHVGFDSFADPAGAQVSAARGDSLKSRWGLSIDRQNSWDSAGGTRRSHVYGLVNLSYEWLDGAQVDVSGTPIASRNRRLWGELGLGGSYSWGNGRYTLYTEVSGDTPIADFGKGYSLKGNAGLRIQF